MGENVSIFRDWIWPTGKPLLQLRMFLTFIIILLEAGFDVFEPRLLASPLYALCISSYRVWPFLSRAVQLRTR